MATGDPPARAETLKNSKIVHQDCRLIQGPVALSAQLVLLLFVLLALVIKRHREWPRRPVMVWLLDIGKQGFSGGAGHTVGIIVAIMVHAASGHASECGWYFVVYCMDGTLGMALAITLHSAATRAAQHLHHHTYAPHAATTLWSILSDIGHYGDPAAPDLRVWGIQVCMWVGCVVCARTLVGVAIVMLIPVLQIVAAGMDARLAQRPNVYLFTVMVGFPLVCNMGQAWIQDQALKWQQKKYVPSKRGDEHLVKEANSS